MWCKSAINEVPASGKLKLRMPDGSVISVAASSSMTVASYDIGGAGRHAKLSLTQGLLRAVVVAAGGPSIFEVSTAVGPRVGAFGRCRLVYRIAAGLGPGRGVGWHHRFDECCDREVGQDFR